MSADAAGPDMPPAIALTSPFHEVLVRDVAASVPSALRPHVDRAASITELNDWLAAAAMLRWVRPEPLAHQAFVQSMAGDPTRAAFALARAVAARMDPPERSREWRTADRLGLALQLSLGLACLGVRSLLVVWVAGPWPAIETAPLWMAASSLLDLPLFATASPALAGLHVIAGCLAIVLWHAFELGVVPAYFERIRQWPARDARLPAPLSWRIDSFHVAWCLQAGALAVAAMARMADEVLRLGSDPSGTEAFVGAVALVVALTVTARACMTAARVR